MLQISDLSLTFSGSRHLFQGLTCSFAPGEWVSLVGPSGCGKSTLLRLVSGLLVPTQGRVTHSAKTMGFVFQEPRLMAWRTVRENLSLPGEIQNRPPAETELEEVLKKVRLEQSILDLFPQQLSGGMKMRVSISRALLTGAELLLMDEPFAALDENTRQILQEEIGTLLREKNRTTLFVTHSLSEALFLSDRILVLGSQGQLLEDYRPALPLQRNLELRSNPLFVEALQGLSKRFRAQLQEGLRGAP